jgi:hypothetical protein
MDKGEAVGLVLKRCERTIWKASPARMYSLHFSARRLGRERHGPRELGLELGDFPGRRGVGLFQRGEFARKHVGDDAQLMLDMIEDQEGFVDAEMHIRQVEIVASRGRDVLHQADGVVADEADGAPGEGGQVGRADAAEAGHEGLQFGQGVAFDIAAFLPADLDMPVLGGEGIERVAAQEGEAGQLLAHLHAFEQEHAVARAFQLEQGGDGRFEIRQELLMQRNYVALGGQGPYLFQ